VLSDWAGWRTLRAYGAPFGVLASVAFGHGCTSGRSTFTEDLGEPPVVIGTCEEAQCVNFPNEPVMQGPIPQNVAQLFGRSSSGEAGVCVVEPPDGAMLPNNWLPPRIRFIPLPSEDLWQITLSSRVERHDLVVYSTRPSWTMDRDTWERLAMHAGGETVEVRVRGVNSRRPEAPSLSKSSFTIAPVSASGTVVYWAADGFYNADGETKLVGFSVGDTKTVDALLVDQVEEYPALGSSGAIKEDDSFGREGEVRCIGCHTSTPDGDAVAFVDNWPWNSVIASITEDSVGKRPDYVTQAASRILQQPWQGAPTFSRDHWETGARIMIQSFGNPNGVGWSNTDLNSTGLDRLIWFDLTYGDTLPDSGSELDQAVRELEGVAFGFIERRGDAGGAVNPDWSHDGNTIAYVSASATLDGHPGGRPRDTTTRIETDIHLVPYNDGAGGDSTPLMGASQPNVGEYYPDYSADDRFIAFTRTASTLGQVYYRPDGEIWVVPAKGGTPTRLAANDPPACTGQSSPGVTNSWPKWSPQVMQVEGKTYYWLIFSSARAHLGQFVLPKDDYSPTETQSSQLYMAAVVADGDEIVETYPAIYLYNQTTNTTNLTPAWDWFQLPSPEIK